MTTARTQRLQENILFVEHNNHILINYITHVFFFFSLEQKHTGDLNPWHGYSKRPQTDFNQDCNCTIVTNLHGI